MLLLLSGATSYAQRATLSGFITDATNGEPLIAAGIRSGDAGSISNNYGFYSLRMTSGHISVTYSHVGYKPQTLDIVLHRDTTVHIRLIPDNELSAATVVAPREAGLQSAYMGAIDVPVNQIKNTPAVLGESDVLKTVQLLPGVQAGTNGFTGLYVRGGGPDENLLLLDGVALYNADHLLGLFSVFMPESVKRVTLYKGSFPARYGGRTSSVLDIRTNDGNNEETRGSVGISLLSSKVHLEGPLVKGRTSYSASARLMHTVFASPIIAAINRNNKSNYWFYDVNAKVTHRIGSKDRLYFNIYSGRDFLSQDEAHLSTKSSTDILWGNTLASMRWNHVFCGNVFLNATLAYNRYRMNTHVGSEDSKEQQTHINYGSGIQDVNLLFDFDHTPAHGHLMRFGAGIIHHVFRPETFSITKKADEEGAVIQDTTFSQNGNTRFKGIELSAYVEDNIAIGDYFSLNPGLRFNFFMAKGRNYMSFQPRLSARVGFPCGFAIKSGYSRMAQSVHLLSSTQITLPIDLWVPVTENIKPVISDQYSIGVYYEIGKEWELSLEGYYKSIHNVLAYRDGVVMLGNSTDWQDKVVMGLGRAYGAELFIQKVSGRTTGWLSYTIAKSEHRFPDSSISGGAWYPYKYDRRHQLHLVVNYNYNSRIQMNATWSAATGGVLTLPERGTVVLAPDGQTLHQSELVAQRGNYRLPPSHRLNVGVNFRKQKKYGERIWTFSVYNLYNQHSADVVMPLFNRRYSGGRIYDQEITLKIITILPVLPSIGYTYIF